VDVPPRPIDDIETYLDDLIVPTSLIEGQGGPMKYWYHTELAMPKVSNMASDFLSAPGELADGLSLAYPNKLFSLKLC
jgi:hypothetical protein